MAVKNRTGAISMVQSDLSINAPIPLPVTCAWNISAATNQVQTCFCAAHFCFKRHSANPTASKVAGVNRKLFSFFVLSLPTDFDGQCDGHPTDPRPELHV